MAQIQLPKGALVTSPSTGKTTTTKPGVVIPKPGQKVSFTFTPKTGAAATTTTGKPTTVQGNPAAVAETFFRQRSGASGPLTSNQQNQVELLNRSIASQAGNAAADLAPQARHTSIFTATFNSGTAAIVAAPAVMAAQTSILPNNPKAIFAGNTEPANIATYFNTTVHRTGTDNRLKFPITVTGFRWRLMTGAAMFTDVQLLQFASNSFLTLFREGGRKGADMLLGAAPHLIKQFPAAAAAYDVENTITDANAYYNFHEPLTLIDTKDEALVLLPDAAFLAIANGTKAINLWYHLVFEFLGYDYAPKSNG